MNCGAGQGKKFELINNILNVQMQLLNTQLIRKITIAAKSGKYFL